MTNQQWSPAALAHELFTAAQLATGEGIENAVWRLAALVEAQQPAPSAAVATTVPRYTIEDMRQARRESYEQGVASAVPQKVTPAMRAAFREAYKDGSIWTDRLDRAVEAMLAAAPQPSPAPQADSQPALPEITAEDRSFLHDNPNTDDIVEWVQHYASAAITADRAMRAQAAPVAQGGGAEPVAYLWQHSETGRTRVVMPDAVITTDASWRAIGPLFLATRAQTRPIALTDEAITAGRARLGRRSAR